MKSKKEVLKMYKDIDKHISQEEIDEIGRQMRVVVAEISLLISEVFDP